MDISQKLKDLRAAVGITQECAAQLLGTTSQTVSKWERGVSQT